MHSLSDFVRYDKSKLAADHRVIVWSRVTGYFFTTFGAVAEDQIIAGMEE